MSSGWAKTTVAVLLAALGCAAFADGADVVIDAAGSRSFQGGSSHGRLLNVAETGEVVLTVADESTTPVAFTAFDATVSGAQTVFRGGIWDFSSSIETNFFDGVTALSNRKTTIEGGAVVKNVNWLVMGGVSGGTDNELAVQGASKLQVANMTLGVWKGGSQRSVCRVSGGAELACAGKLSLTDATTSYHLYGRQTGNALYVSGENTKLTVGGETSLGRLLSSYDGSQGGNLLSIADGATADLQTLSVGRGMRHGESNVVHIAGGAHVTMTDLRVNSEYSDETGWKAGNTVEILDGAVVTNTGTLALGGYGRANQWVSHAGNRLVVSNAAFHTAKLFSYNSIRYLVPTPQSELVISGEQAQFTCGETPHQLFWGPGAAIVVENGATYTLPYQKFALYDACANCKIVARSGARLNLPAGFIVGGQAGCVSNSVEVLSGATASAKEVFEATSAGGWTIVDDATLEAGWGVSLIAANRLIVRGSRPKVEAKNTSVTLSGNSSLDIELPATGYDEGYATHQNPVVKAHSHLRLEDTSTLHLKGVDELLAFCAERHLKKEYVLLAGNPLTLDETMLDGLRAQLPDGVTLESGSYDGHAELILKFKPKFGMMMILR